MNTLGAPTSHRAMPDQKEAPEQPQRDAVGVIARSSLQQDIVALAGAVPEPESMRERVVRSLWFRRSPEDAARCEAAGVRSADDLVALYREGAPAPRRAPDDSVREVSADEAEEMLRTATAIGGVPHGCFEPLARTVVRLHGRLEGCEAVIDGARRLPWGGEIIDHESAGGRWLVALREPDEILVKGIDVAFCDPRRLRSCVAIGEDGRPSAWPSPRRPSARPDERARDVERSADALEAAALRAPPGPYTDDGYRLRAPAFGGEEGEVLWEYKGSPADGAEEASQFAVAAREHALRVVLGWRALRAAGSDVVVAVLGGGPPESVVAAARRLARRLGKDW